jgi:Putative MetA-pathway of phenol degradation
MSAMKQRYFYLRHCFLLLPLFVMQLNLSGQTDIDAIMMEKNAFCVGPMYSHSWKNYWEGTLKRDNLNLGRVSTNAYSVMGNYGLTRKLNLLFSIPYIRTKASAGTLKGMNGMQDLSLFGKWRFYQKRKGSGVLSVFGIAGVSLPVSNYVADYLPLSIGLKSKTASARIMGDYLMDKLFVTGSATYVFRSNMELDRNSYYTTELHLTNKVAMPDAMNFNFRAGYRSFRLIAEAVVNNWTTLGGFDITRNNMPFPSNRMNATTAGVNIKYVIPSVPQLSVVTGGNMTIAGRNMGQATTVYGSLFYVIDLSRKEKSTDQPSKMN